jgi:hypothetical protein
MSQKQPLKVGATPGKLALIGVLAVVLVGVIASNWPSADAPPVDAAAVSANPTSVTAPPPPTKGATDTKETGSTSPFGEFAEDRHWPEFPVQEAAAFDPFEISKWAAPPASVDGGPAYNQEQFNELLAAENAIIFVAGDKRIARIGDQEFQIGDVFGRFKITEISSKGVVLSEVQ